MYWRTHSPTIFCLLMFEKTNVLPLLGVYNYPRPTGVRPVWKRANVGQMGHRREPNLQTGNVDFQEPDLCRKISHPNYPNKKCNNQNNWCIHFDLESEVSKDSFKSDSAWKPKSSTIKWFSIRLQKAVKCSTISWCAYHKKYYKQSCDRMSAQIWIYLFSGKTYSNEPAIFSNSASHLFKI